MIRLQGVRVWRPEWGDPNGVLLAGVATVLFGAGFFRVWDTGRVGWPDDAFFADRLDDPVKFYVILVAIGLAGLVALAIVVSLAWDLVARWRRDSGGTS
ncbi:hypothetical protein [Brevundimonas bacteroides]|uniref:hypothetical protein n=1 Tax=Brevundimonas bacteroides TaxID=74311 RepID=UPI000497F371|nr:hypothetical protein [Brevundimonas bacteroides]